MASYTGAQAIALVKQAINAVAVGGNWENSDLLSYLNISLEKVALVVPSDLYGPLAIGVSRTASYVSSPDIPTAAIPSGVFKIVYMSLGDKPVRKISLDLLHSKYEHAASRPFTASSPLNESNFYAMHDSFLFYPRYTTSKDYYLRYVKAPDTLTDFTTMDCHPALQNLVVFLAADLAMEQDGRLENANLIHQKITNEIQFLAKDYDIDTQQFSLALIPGQPAPPEV
jgi:hypothetical protein